MSNFLLTNIINIISCLFIVLLFHIFKIKVESFFEAFVVSIPILFLIIASVALDTRVASVNFKANHISFFYHPGFFYFFIGSLIVFLVFLINPYLVMDSNHIHFLSFTILLTFLIFVSSSITIERKEKEFSKLYEIERESLMH